MLFSNNHTKICIKCFQEKPILEFSPRKNGSADGFNNICKKCMRIWMSKWRRTQNGINSIKNSRAKLSWKINHLALTKKHQSKYPERRKARYVVCNAVRAGKIIKPKTCSRCGSENKIQSHHYLGYSEKHWLDIEWLCISCHRIADGLLCNP